MRCIQEVCVLATCMQLGGMVICVGGTYKTNNEHNPLQRPRCIVCTRQDRQGEFRKSGFKCKECFGKKQYVTTPPPFLNKKKQCGKSFGLRHQWVGLGVWVTLGWARGFMNFHIILYVSTFCQTCLFLFSYESNFLLQWRSEPGVQH